jgi:hypothetical protein
MKTMALLTAALIVLVSAGGIKAQEFSHYYTPYGLRLPNLEAREYALTLCGAYNSQKWSNIFEDASYESRQTYFNHQFSLGGTYAIVRQLLVSVGLVYYPERFTVNQFISDFLGDREFRTKNKSTIQPTFSLVIKPSPALEIYSSFDYTSMKREDIDNAGDVDDRTSQRLTNFRFEINYIGKL